ncbi:MAG: hypothetical protein HRT38_02965 [Alteromonadaceae bacterium]|nr:hypothetical protein [Alteromonadaceae bacterium]
MSSKKVSQNKKSRTSLFVLLAAFALPIIIAKLALEQNWLDYGVTNKGSLLESELTLSQIGLNTADYDEKWLILYTLPEQCDDQCEKALESVHNTYVALGKEMPRVIPVALTQRPFSPEQIAQIKLSKWRVEDMPSIAKNLIEHSQVYIVDPLGNIIMAHQIPADVENLSQFGKQILSDMKKLLKYSRIG